MPDGASFQFMGCVELRQAEADKVDEQRGELEFFEDDFPDLKA